MTRPLVPAVVLLLAAPGVAEFPTSVEQIRAVERPQEHFYGAIADGPPRLRWELSTTSAPLGTPVTLTLVVQNVVNPYELTRPPLLELPGFRDLFSAVEDLPDEPNGSDGVAFRYKVTPRNEGTWRVPELTYSYYARRAGEGSRTQTVYARQSAPFTVTKPPQEPATTAPLAAPDEFFERREGGAFARGGGPPWWAWVALPAAGAVAAAGWVIGWRVFFPDAARLARVRRNKAVRTALDRLRKGHPTAEQIAVTVRNYLITRWGLAFTAQTPAEVAAGLAQVGVSAERAAEAEGLLRACDAARFGGDTGVSANRAAVMIERWEGVSPPSA
jgi:hypothetical protein